MYFNWSVINDYGMLFAGKGEVAPDVFEIEYRLPVVVDGNPGDSAFFIWKGFFHDWQRTAVGFKTPHRISTLKNYIDNMAIFEGPGTGIYFVDFVMGRIQL